MELEQYLQIVRRWWLVLTLALVLGAGTAYVVSQLIDPTYEAKATLLVVQREVEGSVQLHDLQTSERLANTFSRLVTIRPVLQQSIDEGGWEMTVDELNRRLSVSNPRTTQLLEISAQSGDPVEASDLANTVAQVFISSNQADLTNRPGLVSIVETAEPPRHPVSPRVMLNTALGGLLSLLAVSGLVMLREYRDDTVKHSSDVSAISGLSVLGHIDEFEGRIREPSEQLQAALRPRSGVAEAYRVLRTNLHYLMQHGHDRRLVLVTSPGSGDGKSTTLANLATVFGLAGFRVLVVDADLRRPTLHTLFSIDNSEGLTSLLIRWDDEPDLKSAIRQTTYANLSLLPSGPIPINPSELLGSGRMQQLLERLRDEYDIVLIDTPPVLAVTDPVVLAPLVDVIALVACAARTRSGELRAAVEELAIAGRPIAGVVLNRVRGGEAGYYYGYGRYRTYGGEVRDAAPRLTQPDDVDEAEDAPPSEPRREPGSQNGAEEHAPPRSAVPAQGRLGDDQPVER